MRSMHKMMKMEKDSAMMGTTMTKMSVVWNYHVIVDDSRNAINNWREEDCVSSIVKRHLKNMYCQGFPSQACVVGLRDQNRTWDAVVLSMRRCIQ